MSQRLYLLIEKTDDPNIVRLRGNSRSRLRGRPSITLRRDDLGPFLPYLLDHGSEPESVCQRVISFFTSLRRLRVRLPSLKTGSPHHADD